LRLGTGFHRKREKKTNYHAEDASASGREKGEFLCFWNTGRPASVRGKRRRRVQKREIRDVHRGEKDKDPLDGPDYPATGPHPGRKNAARRSRWFRNLCPATEEREREWKKGFHGHKPEKSPGGENARAFWGKKEASKDKESWIHVLSGKEHCGSLIAKRKKGVLERI